MKSLNFSLSEGQIGKILGRANVAPAPLLCKCCMNGYDPPPAGKQRPTGSGAWWPFSCERTRSKPTLRGSARFYLENVKADAFTALTLEANSNAE